MFSLSFGGLWRITWIILLVQLINGAITYFVWLSYGNSAPFGAIVGLWIFFTILIIAIDAALEKAADKKD